MSFRDLHRRPNEIGKHVFGGNRSRTPEALPHKCQDHQIEIEESVASQFQLQGRKRPHEIEHQYFLVETEIFLAKKKNEKNFLTKRTF